MGLFWGLSPSDSVPRHIRFSFRARGDGAIQVLFYRYVDTADKDNPDRFRKHTFNRKLQKTYGNGGKFKLTPETATYSGEYTIPAGEWCAIVLQRAGSSSPATVADVSVVVVDE